MQGNLDQALLYETLYSLYKGKEEVAWAIWCEIAQKADVSRPLPEIISAVSEVVGLNSFTISEEYYRIRNSFASFRTSYEILKADDSRLPSCVKEFRFLYAAGDLSLLQKPKVGIGGLRTPSVMGKENAIRVAKECHEGRAVPVATLDTGLDAYALLYALNDRIPSIAVLSSSLRECVPESQKKLMVDLANNGSLLITCFSPSRKAERWFNIPRNRLLVALSQWYAVCEEKDGGPAWKLASLAAESGKGVILFQNQLENTEYTYPSRFQAEHGCHIWKKKGDIRSLLPGGAAKKRSKADPSEQLTLF